MPATLSPTRRFVLALAAPEIPVAGARRLMAAVFARRIRRPASRVRSTVRNWDAHYAKRKAVIDLYQAAIAQVVTRSMNEMLRKLPGALPSLRAAHSGEGSAVFAAAAADVLFDLDSFTEGLEMTVRKVSAAVLHTAGSQAHKEMGMDDPFSMPDQAAKRFISQRANKIKDIPVEVHEQVKAAVNKGIDAGESEAQIAGRIKEVMGGIADGRARTIASTETAAAYGAAREEAMQSAGVTHRKWLTSGRENVRPAHAAANGQTIGPGELFHVGGEDLRYPGDENGSPENVINCHCVACAIDPEEKG